MTTTWEGTTRKPRRRRTPRPQGAAPQPTTATTTTPGRPVGRNPLTRLFLWLAGVDRTLIETRVERYRYVGIGVFLVLIATVAGVMFTLMASTIHGGFTPVLIPFAAGWAALILWADRSIVAEPSYGDLTHADTGTGAARTGWWSRTGRHLPQYLFRVVIAVGAAFVVTEAVLLLIFHAEIRHEMDRMHSAQVATAQQVDQRGQTAEINRLRAAEQANNDRVAAADEDVRKAEDALAQEARGTGGTGHPGYGQVAQQRSAEVDRLRTVANDTRTQMAARNADIDRQIADLEKARQNEINASTAAIADDRGWITQEDALRRVLAANRGSLLVRALPWVVRVTLLAIDLLPVSLKLLARPTLYDRRVRAQAELTAYRTRRWLQSGRDSIDQLADLDRVRATTLYDLAREEENYRKSTRLGHLNGKGW